MTEETTNIHGTAIVVAKTGLLFLGPSGIGKSSLAFSCLAAAKPLGLFSALVADDRVLISKRNDHVIAECPPSIAGLIEVRGTGILKIPYISPVLVHFAVLPVDLSTADRLPEEDEQMEVADGIFLPVIRISTAAANPLAIIMAKIPIKLN
jgi:serine kinase of HPr protein (carbohydrate metabolism regulator)